MEKFGDLGLVGVADYEGNARKGGDFVGGALGVASGYDDSGGGVGGVKFADCVAGLGVCRSGDGAGVEDHDIGRSGIRGDGVTLVAELALDGRAVSLSGTAAELLNKERAHQNRRDTSI